MKKQFEITIRPLTAIHIGTGEKNSGLDYVVQPVNKDTNMYLSYSHDSLLKRISQNPEHLTAFERATNTSMKALREFFEKHLALKEDLAYACDVTKSFEQEYERKRQGDPLINSCEVLTMYRPAGKKGPVIPGSSLKGAIRTAMLNLIMHTWTDDEFYGDEYKTIAKAKDGELKFQEVKKAGEQLSRRIFGKSPQFDIFRSLYLSDIPFQAKDTQLVGCIENIAVTENSGIETKGIPIYAEVLRGELMGGKASGICHATIDVGLQDVLFTGSNSVSLPKIAEACNYFFMREFAREADRFYISQDDRRLKLYHQLYNLIKKFDSKRTDMFLIRVGRFSQVEFVTAEPLYRLPKVPRNRGWGNTRMVFNYDGQLLPLGWCLCTIEECS